MECGDKMYSNCLESHFDDKLLKESDKKFKISQKAVKMVPERAVVILDSGTTVLQIAKLLNIKNDLVIITNSLIVAQALENTRNRLLVTGGELRKNSMCFVGNWATKAIESIQADIAFIGCDGFHKDGPCVRSYRELEVKQRIIENSKKVVLAADASKFNIEGLYRFATFKQINHLITNSSISNEQLQLLSKQVEVSIV